VGGSGDVCERAILYDSRRKAEVRLVVRSKERGDNLIGCPAGDKGGSVLTQHLGRVQSTKDFWKI